MVVLFTCGVGYSAFSMNPEQEITYPPKPPSTSLRDVSDAFDSLTKSTKDLSHAVVGDIKKQGIIKSVHSHIKFYGSIFIFFFLWMFWFWNREH